MRAASALPSLAFLVLAATLLWSGMGWSLVGLLAATTPMVHGLNPFYSHIIFAPRGFDIAPIGGAVLLRTAS
jgi:hypothetical protein